MTVFEKEFDNLLNSVLGPAKYLNKSFNTQYPPYNIIRVDDVETVLELAVAGFKETELSVSTKNGYIFINGKKEDNNVANYLYKGISTKEFTKSFTLNEGVKVTGANYSDGILSVHLEKTVQNEDVTNIPIGSSERTYLTERSDIV